MALLLAKPIIWNRDGYVRPSGVKVHSGFPKANGFGHEEWNNAPGMRFVEDGVEHRVFHTEGVGNAPVDDEAGRIVVFMYASHDNVQELVGVAANATWLKNDEQQRRRLVDQLDLKRLGDDVWAVPRVRTLHANRAAFDKVWRGDLNWIPNWRCPAETFFWLQTPAPLDSQRLRGTQKLLTMFDSYTVLDERQALMMLDSVPAAQRTPQWHRVRAEIETSDEEAVAEDLSALAERKDLKQTTKLQLVEARLGQGRFRRDVERLWNDACAVSGSALGPVLRASHILAWKQSNDRERLDANNGLLLTAELDALFDRGLISFDDDGKMLVSRLVPKSDRELFGLPRSLRRQPSTRQISYLRKHRRHWGFA